PPGGFAPDAAPRSCFRRSVNFPRTSGGMAPMGKFCTTTRALPGPFQSNRTMRSPMIGAARRRFSTSSWNGERGPLSAAGGPGGRAPAAAPGGPGRGGTFAGEPPHHLVDLLSHLVVGGERARLLELADRRLRVSELCVGDGQVVVRLKEVGMLGEDLAVGRHRLGGVAGREIHRG